MGYLNVNLLGVPQVDDCAGVEHSLVVGLVGAPLVNKGWVLASVFV